MDVLGASSSHMQLSKCSVTSSTPTSLHVSILCGPAVKAFDARTNFPSALVIYWVTFCYTVHLASVTGAIWKTGLIHSLQHLPCRHSKCLSFFFLYTNTNCWIPTTQVIFSHVARLQRAKLHQSAHKIKWAE